MTALDRHREAQAAEAQEAEELYRVAGIVELHERARRFPVRIALQASEPNATASVARWSDPEVRRYVLGALKRVGTSDEARARWMLRFGSMDLAALSPGQHLDLQWEVLAFLLPASRKYVDLEVDVDGEVEVPVEEVHAWLLHGLVGLRDSIVEGRPGRWRVEVPTLGQFRRDGNRVVVDLWDDEAPTGMRFRAAALQLLTRQAQAHRLRFCHNCDRAFMARRRQAYCAPRCSQTFRTRKYRAKNSERSRGQRHRAYERMIKKKLPGAKVATRAQSRDKAVDSRAKGDPQS